MLRFQVTVTVLRESQEAFLYLYLVVGASECRCLERKSLDIGSGTGVFKLSSNGMNIPALVVDVCDSRINVPNANSRIEASGDQVLLCAFENAYRAIMSNEFRVHLLVGVAEYANGVVAASNREQMRFQLAKSEQFSTTDFCFPYDGSASKVEVYDSTIFADGSDLTAII